MPKNEMPSGDVLSSHAKALQRMEYAPTLGAWVIARLRAGHYDELLAVGASGNPGSALAVHETRLTSVREREAIARSLRNAVRDARVRANPLSSRVPLHLSNI